MICHNIKRLLEKAAAGRVDSNDFKVVCDEGTEESQRVQIEVQHQPPFSKWLYKQLHKKVGDPFIVETKEGT